MIEPFKRYEQTITVAIRTQVGVDAHNSPVYEWEQHQVGGVIASPQEPTDLPTGKWESTRQEGHQAKMYVMIPKTCDLNFENARVELQGVWFNVLGIPQPCYNAPTRFDKYVILEKETG